MEDGNPISKIDLKQPPDEIVSDCTIDAQESD